MRLFGREALLALLEKVGAELRTERRILLVGGSAVLVLCEEALVTRDIDLFPVDGLDEIIDAVRRVTGNFKDPVDINTSSTAFETYLPEGWEERLVFSREFSTNNIHVYTPSPEDLAVMKVFRFNEKDQLDILRLSKLERFSPEAFFNRFLTVLPQAIGDPRWHAQSFSLVWNKLYPEEPHTTDELLSRAEVLM